MEEKIYTCECGKTFTKPNSFNGHKSNCKEHFLFVDGNLDRYNNKCKNLSKSLKPQGEKLHNESISKKQSLLDIWLSEQHTCEKCGKIMIEKFGSGRFCSRHCANSRVQTDEIKAKKSKATKSHFNYIEYDGQLMTIEAANKLEIKKGESKIKKSIKLNKQKELIEKIDLKNSPYKDFDYVIETLNTFNDKGFYFLKHDSEGKIINRIAVSEYRYLVEYKLNRKLEYNEVVHHIDGNHYNNDINNLQVMTRSEHAILHSQK